MVIIYTLLKEERRAMKPEDAKKIISTAIDREVEAYTFYRGIADKVKDANLKKLFAELPGRKSSTVSSFRECSQRMCRR